MTEALLDALDHGWVWTLMTVAVVASACVVVERWEQVRRWRVVDAVLVALAVLDHYIAGSSPRHRPEHSAPVDPWSLALPERYLWLVSDADHPDTFQRGA